MFCASLLVIHIPMKWRFLPSFFPMIYDIRLFKRPAIVSNLSKLMSANYRKKIPGFLRSGEVSPIIWSRYADFQSCIIINNYSSYCFTVFRRRNICIVYVLLLEYLNECWLYIQRQKVHSCDSFTDFTWRTYKYKSKNGERRLTICNWKF